MRLWRKRSATTTEQQLLRLLEKRGMKAFRVLPSGEALMIDHKRPSSPPSTEPSKGSNDE